jgi:GNAT superfamily N-acetyltransferase
VTALDVSPVTIRALTTDDEILSARGVMRELRPNVADAEYLATVRRMMADGYRQVALFVGGEAQAIAGYRCLEMLYAGRILYVDDLSTGEQSRSLGYGRALLQWLKAEARADGCAQLHLDSGVQRDRAHRFYFREGMAVSAFHFKAPL